MNDQIETYLASLDVAGPVRSRIDEVARGFELLCGGDLEHLFVSDVVDPSSGDRVYESLWGFRGSYWMEARDLMKQIDIDISSYARSILYLGVQYENLDLSGTANPESRLSLEIETAKVRYSSLTATGQNCDELLRILNELLLPNLRESVEGDATLAGA